MVTRSAHVLRSAMLATVITACGSNDAMAPNSSVAGANGPKGNNSVVRITPQSDTADALGETIQLTANAVAPTWTSLTPGIVTVDAAGRVVSVATGLGLVQASVGRKADTAEVLVRQIPAFLSVTPDTLHFFLSGEPQTLTATLVDANGFAIPGRPAASWSSDDPAVATVDTGGVVTATIGAGVTWIRAIFQALSDSAFVNTPATPFP
jgi:hypothetical protein